MAITRRGFLGSVAAAGAGLAVPAGARAQATAPRSSFALVPKGVACHVVYGNCPLCVIGDSIATDSSSQSNLSHGIQRTWRPHRFVARFGRFQMGPPPWATQTAFDSFYYGAPTGGWFGGITPGTALGGGEQAISPNIVSEWRFGSTDVPDFGPMLALAYLNDPANYGVGDWTAGPVRARLAFWRANGHMVPLLAVRGKRGATTVATVEVPMGDGMTPAPSAVDVECGSAAGLPGIEITSVPSVDERGRYAYWLGAGFYRHDGNGVPLPGLGLMQIGEGGWTTADHLSDARCTAANLAGFMAASLKPNTFLLQVGANQTPEEQASLNAGNHAIYRANCAAIIQRFTQAALAAGAQGPIRWLLANPYPLGWSEVNAQARARALSELRALDPDHRAFVDLSRLAAGRNGNASWYTADGAHPTPDGAAYLAGLIWSQIAASA